MTENIDLRTNPVEENQDPTKKEKPRKPRSKKIAMAMSVALLGLSLASCQQNLSAEEQKRIDTLGDDSPQVMNAYQTYLENKNPNNQGNTVDNLGLNAPETFEIPATDQTIHPGSRVRVVETGGYGLNIRTEVGIDSSLEANVADGTIFKVIEFAGEQDGYRWVKVESETKEDELAVVGYAVIDWFEVLNDAPIQ